MPFQHNSTLADSEPDWGSVDKTALPQVAFADHGEPGKKSTWGYPHHWIKGGASKDKDGIWTDGTCYLHKGGLNAAWAAANGARSGQDASPAIKAHLQTHRKALGLDKGDKSKGDADYPLLAASFFGKCWALLPAKLDEICALAEALLEGKKIDWPEGAAAKRGQRAEEEPYQIQDGVAVIPVYGVLDKRMNLFSNMSGGTSYEVLAGQVRQAAADPNCEAILLDVDSPGGSVDGVELASDEIRAARDAKPVVSYANGQMTSAAYWLGSAAHKVVAPAAAHVGSIGVRLVHRDVSGADEKAGLRRTAIYSGRYKNVGSDTGPLSPEDQAELQRMSDTHYGLFLNGVARNRGIDPATVHQEMGDGRIFIGRQAKDAGLVDQMGNKDDALALAKQMAAKAAQKRRLDAMDLTTLKSQYPELYAEALALGARGSQDKGCRCPDCPNSDDCTDKGTGAKAERARVVEIMEACGAEGPFLEMFKSGIEVKAALKLILANQEKFKAAELAAMRTGAPPAVGTEPPQIGKATTDNPKAGKAPLEDRAKQEWDAKPELKDEFGGKFELYLTYRRHEEAGDIKIHNK